ALTTILDGERWAPAEAYNMPPTPNEEREVGQRLRELTPQQFRVLQMLGAGSLNKQIAYDLGVSEATIKAHVTAILRKLGVTNRTQAVLMAGKLASDDDSIVLPPEADWAAAEAIRFCRSGVSRKATGPAAGRRVASSASVDQSGHPMALCPANHDPPALRLMLRDSGSRCAGLLLQSALPWGVACFQSWKRPRQ